MRHLGSLFLGCWVLAGQVAIAPEQPKYVSIIQLIANPEKFDGELVVAGGFLSVTGHRRPAMEESTLFLHREDAENLLLPNSIWLEPTAEMKRNRKELNGMYVAVTGRFRAGSRGHYFGQPGGITDITGCNIVSDPNRPAAHRWEQLVPPGAKPK
jgi:hypothetical protein